MAVATALMRAMLTLGRVSVDGADVENCIIAANCAAPQSLAHLSH